jgi:hypothetical protein
MFACADGAGQFAAVMVEAHVEEVRAHPRALSRRALATEQAADGRKARGAERRPAKQAGAENAEWNGNRELAPHARIRGHRQRHDAADDLDRARQHRRISGAEHLQQQIEQDNGDDAGN